jgi:hypothetical protein
MRKTLAALLLTAACAPLPGALPPLPSPADVTMASDASDALPASAPDVLPVTAASPLPPQRSNAEMAGDFLDLEFQMESGRRLPRLTRFEGPVTIAFTGPAPATARADLNALIARIRTEAGVDLRLAAPGQAPAIAIIYSTRAALRQVVPTAACFVVPGVASLAEYRTQRHSPALDWTKMLVRTRAAVFLPADTSPQEMRDCLHEEVAQALGPLNDLYRLPDSVFNDDNFQSVLTGFDMLMLRLHYAPDLQSGMSEADVAARLPALLARLNPGGAHGPAPVSRDTPRAWLALVDRALGPVGADKVARLAAARRCLALAQSQGWHDNRLGLAWFALGRALTPSDPVAAETAYRTAHDIYRSLPDAGIHAAHVAMQLAALDLSLGRYDAALAWTRDARPALGLAQNPALQATLMLIEAAVAEATGDRARAAALRLDSQGLARYGFGAASQIAAREADIARLAAKGQDGAPGG